MDRRVDESAAFILPAEDSQLVENGRPTAGGDAGQDPRAGAVGADPASGFPVEISKTAMGQLGIPGEGTEDSELGAGIVLNPAWAVGRARHRRRASGC